jgi:hypothetical protein
LPEQPDSPETPDLEMTIESVPADPAATKFIDWLRGHRAGLLDFDLREAFVNVVQAVQATGKPGSVVLTLKVTPEKGGMLAVADTINEKPPKVEDPKLYWADWDGGLTRDNPLQPKLLIPPSKTETD